MVLFLEDHKGPVKEEVVEICSMILWRCFLLIKMPGAIEEKHTHTHTQVSKLKNRTSYFLWFVC